jgi:hypothetical protein
LYRPSEKRDHVAWHEEHDRVTAVKGEVLGYAERERQWTEGDNLLRAAKSDDERVRGAELMLDKFRDRGYERAIAGGWGMEYPSREEFMRAAAEVDLLKWPAASALLRERYAYVPHPGGSFDNRRGWVPSGNARKGRLVHRTHGYSTVCGETFTERPVLRDEQVSCLYCLTGA